MVVDLFAHLENGKMNKYFNDKKFLGMNHSTAIRLWRLGFFIIFGFNPNHTILVLFMMTLL